MENKKLGDKVEALINKVMPKIAKKVKEKDCGCEERKIWLNNLGGNFG